MSSTAKTILTALLIVVAVMSGGSALAEVVASVDRSSVELNESFILKLTVDSRIDAEPNVESLDQDFYVGSRSYVSNTTIMNGDVQKVITWSYVLMAKHEGELTIPPVSIGNERSNPVQVTVLPQSIAVPGEADIFITAEVDSTHSYVQAQVLYTVKTYRAVATRQPRWSEPASSGVETLVEIAGEEKNYDSILNGKAYNVVERVYAFFPQESGQLEIAPARFEARVLRNGRITGRKVFQSESSSIEVSPIPPPPADYPDAAWFPAKSVELSQDWSRELTGLTAGMPITRRVSVVASGQLETQIPVIEIASMPGIRVYPDKPELRTVAGPDGVRALRRDQYALIGSVPGKVELPEIVLPWWNVDKDAWQIARLPATTLTILPSPDAVEPPPPVETTAQQQVPAETVVIHSELWQRVSEALMMLWLLTLASWWWSRHKPARTVKEPAVVPVHKQQLRYLKTARKAALDNDASALKAALLAWGRLEWPEHAPRNLGDLARRVSLPLSTELERLCSASYGPGGDWDGKSVAQALKSFSVLNDDGDRPDSIDLPPLLPAAD